MVEVGVRELKSRLSHYLRLMEAGETVAIKMRDRIIGFLTNMKADKKKSEDMSLRALKKKIEQLKKEGVLRGGKVGGKMSRFKPVSMTPGPSTTEIIRQMRDEGW